jgi:hypothetical protein
MRSSGLYGNSKKQRIGGLVPDISLKNTNNEYIKTLFLEAQAAHSNLRYAETFTPGHYTSAIQRFYETFSTLFDCTKYLIRKNMLSDIIIDEDKLPDDVKKQNNLIENVDNWLSSSTVDSINIGVGKRLFNEYSWIVVHNLF